MGSCWNPTFNLERAARYVLGRRARVCSWAQSSPMSLDFTSLLGWMACAHVHSCVRGATPMILACGVEPGGYLT